MPICCSLCGNEGHNKRTCAPRLSPEAFDALPLEKRWQFLAIHAVKDADGHYMFQHNKQVKILPTPPGCLVAHRTETQQVEVCGCCYRWGCTCELCDCCGYVLPERHHQNRTKSPEGHFHIWCGSCRSAKGDEWHKQGYSVQPCLEREGWYEFVKKEDMRPE